MNTCTVFLRTGSAILVISSAAKLFSGVAGVATLFSESDPLFGFSFRALILIAASLEAGVVAICIFRPTIDGLLAVAWLSTVFLIYRIGLWWIGWQQPCSCLGNLTDALHISPELADNVMKGLLAFMLIGSVSLLVLHRGRTESESGSNNPRAAGG